MEKLFVLVICVDLVSAGGGRMLDPPGRGSLWRAGIKSKQDYDDHRLNCGGVARQYNEWGARCGVCGDDYGLPIPRPHELGGYFGQGIISRNYSQNQIIEGRFQLVGVQRGSFYLQICSLDQYNTNIQENSNQVQDCLEATKLQLLNQDDTYLFYPTPENSGGSTDLRLRYELPANLTCQHCLLRWRYVTSRTWGRALNGTECLGCGPQEEYRACADISIYQSKTKQENTDIVNKSEEPKRFFDKSYKETFNTVERNPLSEGIKSLHGFVISRPAIPIIRIEENEQNTLKREDNVVIEGNKIDKEIVTEQLKQKPVTENSLTTFGKYSSAATTKDTTVGLSTATTIEERTSTEKSTYFDKIVPSTTTEKNVVVSVSNPSSYFIPSTTKTTTTATLITITPSIKSSTSTTAKETSTITTTAKETSTITTTAEETSTITTTAKATSTITTTAKETSTITTTAKATSTITTTASNPQFSDAILITTNRINPHEVLFFPPKVANVEVVTETSGHTDSVEDSNLVSIVDDSEYYSKKDLFEIPANEVDELSDHENIFFEDDRLYGPRTIGLGMFLSIPITCFFFFLGFILYIMRKPNASHDKAIEQTDVYQKPRIVTHGGSAPALYQTLSLKEGRFTTDDIPDYAAGDYAVPDVVPHDSRQIQYSPNKSQGGSLDRLDDKGSVHSLNNGGSVDGLDHVKVINGDADPKCFTPLFERNGAISKSRRGRLASRRWGSEDLDDDFFTMLASRLNRKQSKPEITEL